MIDYEEKAHIKPLLISTAEERAAILESSPPARESSDIRDDPYTYMSHLIFNRWKPFILRAIHIDEGTYYSRFLRQLPITQKVLSQNLKELQQDGLVFRRVLPEVPPRVEYCLTETGRNLVELLDLIYDWGWIDMRKKGLPVDVMGEMWHGYRSRDEEMMNRPSKRERSSDGTGSAGDGPPTLK